MKWFNGKRGCCYHFLQAIGLTITFLGILLLLNFECIYDILIKTALTIRPGTRAYNGWVKTDPPLTMDVYFFNWTNPEDLYNSSVKPRFEEVGPYRFKEVHEKYDVVIDGDTMSYTPVRKYYFSGDESPRQLDDVIQTINSLAVIAAYKARFFSRFKKFMFAVSLSSTSQLRLTKTVDELLFTGYDDKFLNMVRPLASVMSMDIGDRYGYYYGRNGTVGQLGNYTINIKYDENFGKVLTYEDKNHTSFFDGKCGEVRGSVGDFYPSDQKRTSLDMFLADLCGNLELEYEKDVQFKGIKAYKFTAQNMFDNGHKKPETACFCKDGCTPPGAFNASACRLGAPIFLSQPHFYNADPYYGSLIEGMEPNRSKHEFYSVMEPDVPEVYFPVFYVDESINLSDEVIIGVRLIQNMPEYNVIFSSTLIVFGILILISTLLWRRFCFTRITNKAEFQKCPMEEFPLKIK